MGSLVFQIHEIKQNVDIHGMKPILNPRPQGSSDQDKGMGMRSFHSKQHGGRGGTNLWSESRSISPDAGPFNGSEVLSRNNNAHCCHLVRFEALGKTEEDCTS